MTQPRAAALSCAAALLITACKDTSAPPPPSDPISRAPLRLASMTCGAMLPPAGAEKTLGHPVRYKEVRHAEARFHVLSCENDTQKAAEVFAFDVGCGSGARERYISVVRTVESAIKQTEPKVGDEAFASLNVYLSWHAKTSCYTTVLLSWRRPRAEWLRHFAGELARFTVDPGK